MKLTKLLKKSIEFGRNFSNIFDFNKTKFARKLFAIFVILMFMGSGVSLEVVAAAGDGGNGIISDEEANAQNEEKGFEERELKDEDYNNADAYEGTPPKIFTNPKFDVTKVPTDKIEQNIDVIIGTGKQNSLTQDQVRAITDPAKIHTLILNMEPANVARFSPEQIGSLSNEQLSALKPEQKVALTTEQLSNGNVLVNVGNLRDLNAANLQAAMRARYGLAEGALFLISESAGEVTITADGKIKNGGLEIELSTITGEKGADIRSIVLTTPEGADKGFKICRKNSNDANNACDTVAISPDASTTMQYSYDPDTNKPYMSVTRDGSQEKIFLQGNIKILDREGRTILEVGEGSVISVAHGEETYTIRGHNNNVKVELNRGQRTLSVEPIKIDPSKTTEENAPYFEMTSQSLTEGASYGTKFFIPNDERGKAKSINILKVNVGTPEAPIYFGSGQAAYNLDLADPESKNAVYTINGDGETNIERDANGKILAVLHNKNEYQLPGGKIQYSEADVKVVQIINGKEKVWDANHQVDFYFSDSPLLRSGKGASVQDILPIQQGELGVVNKINAITDDTSQEDRKVTLKVITLGDNGATVGKDEVISCGTRTGAACREYLTAEFNKRSLQNRIVLNKLSEREAGGRSFVTITSDPSGVLHTAAVASISGGKDGNRLEVDRDGSKSILEFGQNAAVYIAPFDVSNPDANQKYVSAIAPNIEGVTIENLYDKNKQFYDDVQNLVSETRTLPLEKTVGNKKYAIRIGPNEELIALDPDTEEYKAFDSETGEIGAVKQLTDEERDNLRDIEITEVTTSHKGAISSKVASQDIDVFKRFAAEGFVDKFKGGLAFADRSSYRSFLNNDAIILGHPDNAEKLAEIKTPDGRIPNVFELNKDTKKLVAAGFARVITDFDTGETTAAGTSSNVAATLDTGILQLAKEDIEKTRAIIGYSEQVIRGYKPDVKGIDDLAEKVVGLYITKAQKDTAKDDKVDVTQLKTQVEINVRNELEKNLGEKGKAIAHTLDAARLSYEAGLADAYDKKAANDKRVQAVDELKKFIRGTGDKFAVQQGIGLIKEEFKLTGNHDGTRKLIQGIILGDPDSIRELGFNLNTLSPSERQELGLELEKIGVSTFSDGKDFDGNIAELKRLTEKYHQNLDDDIGRVMLQRIDEFKQGFAVLSREDYDKLDPSEKKEYDAKKTAYSAYLKASGSTVELKTPEELKALNVADRDAYNKKLNEALTAANTKSRTNTNDYLKDAISKQFLTPEQRAALLGTLAASLASEGDLGKIQDIFGNGANANIKASLALLNDKQKDQVKASFAKTLAANVDEKKLAALRQSDEFKGLPADIQAQLVYAAYERLFNSVATNEEKVRLANLAIAAGKEKGVAVSPEVYKTLSRIYASQGKLLESDLANREAAAALQQKAATQNYDSRKGFNFGTFVQGLDELARDNIEVQYAQKRFDAVIASGTFVVGATNLDRSAGDALDNNVRNAMANSYTNLKQYGEAIKERKTIIYNILGLTEGVKPLSDGHDAEKAMLKQQFVDANIGISNDVLSSEDIDEIKRAIQMLKESKTQDIKGVPLFNQDDAKLIDALDKQALATTINLGGLYEKKDNPEEANTVYKNLLKEEKNNPNLDDETKAFLRDKVRDYTINKAISISEPGTDEANAEAKKLLAELYDSDLGLSIDEIIDVRKRIIYIDLAAAQKLIAEGKLDEAKALLNALKGESVIPQTTDTIDKDNIRNMLIGDSLSNIDNLLQGIQFKKDETLRTARLTGLEAGDDSRTAANALQLFQKAMNPGENEEFDLLLVLGAASKYAQHGAYNEGNNIENLKGMIGQLEQVKEALAKNSQNADAIALMETKIAELRNSLAEKERMRDKDVADAKDRTINALRGMVDKGESLKENIQQDVNLLSKTDLLEQDNLFSSELKNIDSELAALRSKESITIKERETLKLLEDKRTRLLEVREKLDEVIIPKLNAELIELSHKGNIENMLMIYQQALERAGDNKNKQENVRGTYISALGNIDASKGTIVSAYSELNNIEGKLQGELTGLEQRAATEQNPQTKRELQAQINQVKMQLDEIPRARETVLLNGEVSYSYEREIPDNHRLDISAPQTDNERGIVANRIELANKYAASSQIEKIEMRADLRRIMQETNSVETLTSVVNYLLEAEKKEGDHGIALQDLQYALKKMRESGIPEDELPPDLVAKEKDNEFVAQGVYELVSRRDSTSLNNRFIQVAQMGIKDPEVRRAVESKLTQKLQDTTTETLITDTNRNIENIVSANSYGSAYGGVEDSASKVGDAYNRGETLSGVGNSLGTVTNAAMGTIGYGGRILADAVSITGIWESYGEVQVRQTAAVTKKLADENEAITKLLTIDKKDAAKIMAEIKDLLPKNADIDGDGKVSGKEALTGIDDSYFERYAEMYSKQSGIEITADDIKNLAIANKRTKGQFASTLILRAAETPEEIRAVQLRTEVLQKLDGDMQTQLRVNRASVGEDADDPGKFMGYDTIKVGGWEFADPRAAVKGALQSATTIKSMVKMAQGVDGQATDWNSNKQREGQGVKMLANLLNPTDIMGRSQGVNQGITLEEINRLASSNDDQDKIKLTKLLGRPTTVEEIKANNKKLSERGMPKAALEPETEDQLSKYKIADIELNQLRQALGDNPQVLQIRASELKNQGKINEANKLMAQSYKQEAEIQMQARNLDGAEQYARLAAQADQGQQAFADKVSSEASWNRATTPYVDLGVQILDVAIGIGGVGAVGKVLTKGVQATGIAAKIANTGAGQWAIKTFQLPKAAAAGEEAGRNTLIQATKVAAKAPANSVNANLAAQTQQVVSQQLQLLRVAKAAGNMEQVSAAAGRISQAQVQLTTQTSVIRNAFLREQVHGAVQALKPAFDMMYKPGEILDESIDEALGEAGESAKTWGSVTASALGSGRSKINLASNSKAYKSQSREEFTDYVKQNEQNLMSYQAVYQGQTYDVDVNAGNGQMKLVQAPPIDAAVVTAPEVNIKPPAEIKIENLDQAQGIIFVENKNGQAMVAAPTGEFGLLQLKVQQQSSKDVLKKAESKTTGGEAAHYRHEQQLVDADADIKGAEVNLRVSQVQLELAQRQMQANPISETAQRAVVDAKSRVETIRDTVHASEQSFAGTTIKAADKDIADTQREIDKLMRQTVQLEDDKKKRQIESQVAGLEYIKQQKVIERTGQQVGLLNLEVSRTIERIANKQAELANTQDQAKKAELQEEIQKEANKLLETETVKADLISKANEERAKSEEIYQDLLGQEEADLSSRLIANLFERKKALKAIQAERQVSVEQKSKFVLDSIAARENTATRVSQLVATGVLTDPGVIDTLEQKSKIEQELSNADKNLGALKNQFLALDEKDGDLGKALQAKIADAEKKNQELEAKLQGQKDRLQLLYDSTVKPELVDKDIASTTSLDDTNKRIEDNKKDLRSEEIEIGKIEQSIKDKEAELKSIEVQEAQTPAMIARKAELKQSLEQEDVKLRASQKLRDGVRADITRLTKVADKIQEQYDKKLGERIQQVETEELRKAKAEEDARKAAAELEAATRKAAQETDLVSEQIKDIGLTADRIIVVHAALKAEGVAKLEELAGFSADEIKVLVPSLTDAEAKAIEENVNNIAIQAVTANQQQVDQVLAAAESALENTQAPELNPASNVVKMSDYVLDASGTARRIETPTKAEAVEAVAPAIARQTGTTPEAAKALAEDSAISPCASPCLLLADHQRKVREAIAETFRKDPRLKGNQAAQTFAKQISDKIFVDLYSIGRGRENGLLTALNTGEILNYVTETLMPKLKLDSSNAEQVLPKVVGEMLVAVEHLNEHFVNLQNKKVGRIGKSNVDELFEATLKIKSDTYDLIISKAQELSAKGRYLEAKTLLGASISKLSKDETKQDSSDKQFKAKAEALSEKLTPAGIAKQGIEDFKAGKYEKAANAFEFYLQSGDTSLKNIENVNIDTLFVQANARAKLIEKGIFIATIEGGKAIVNGKEVEFSNPAELRGKAIGALEYRKVDMKFTKGKCDGCSFIEVKYANGQTEIIQITGTAVEVDNALKQLEAERADKRAKEAKAEETRLQQEAAREETAREETKQTLASSRINVRRVVLESPQFRKALIEKYRELNLKNQGRTGDQRTVDEKIAVLDNLENEALRARVTQEWGDVLAIEAQELGYGNRAGSYYIYLTDQVYFDNKAEMDNLLATREAKKETPPAVNRIKQVLQERARITASSIQYTSSGVSNTITSNVKAAQTLSYLQKQVDKHLEETQRTQAEIETAIKNVIDELALSSDKKAKVQKLLEGLMMVQCQSPCSLADRAQRVQALQEILDAAEIQVTADVLTEASKQEIFAIENARRILHNIRDNKVSATQIHSQIALANNLISEIDTKGASDLRQAAQDILLQEILKAAEQAEKLAEEQNKKQEEQTRQLEAVKIAAELAKARAAVQQADARAKLIDEIHSAFAVIDKNRIIGNSDKFTKKFNVINDKIRQAENTADASVVKELEAIRNALSKGMDAKLKEKLKANQNLNIAIEKSRALTTVIKEMSKKARDDIVQAKSKADDVLNTKIDLEK